MKSPCQRLYLDSINSSGQKLAYERKMPNGVRKGISVMIGSNSPLEAIHALRELANCIERLDKEAHSNGTMV